MATPSILTRDIATQVTIHAQRELVIKHPIETGKTLGKICLSCTVLCNTSFPKLTAVLNEIKEKFSTGSAFDANLGSLALNAVIDKAFRVIGSNQETRYNTEIEKINALVLGLPVVETGSISLEHSFSTLDLIAGVQKRIESLKFGPKDSEHNISLHDAEDRLANLETFITEQASAASFTGLDISKMVAVMSGKAASNSLFKDLLAEQSLLEQIVRFKNTGDVKHFTKIIEKAGTDPVILDSIIKEKPTLIPVITAHYDAKGYDKTELKQIIAGDFVAPVDELSEGSLDLSREASSEDTRSSTSANDYSSGEETDWSAIDEEGTVSGSED